MKQRFPVTRAAVYETSGIKVPQLKGVIDRRILVNYRVDPDVLTAILPPPFRPKIHGGYGMAGICLIRLHSVRPSFLHRWMGVSSENAAHRAAVEWNSGGRLEEGVYVRRRDTDSHFNALAGGRVFPGIHSLARFETKESDGHLSVKVQSRDDYTRVEVEGYISDRWPEGSVFSSLEEASSFFRAGSLGYSATCDPRRFQGVELRCDTWKVEPLSVSLVHSSYFDDRSIFPQGSIEFDCALVMRNIGHEWQMRPDLCCVSSVGEVLVR
jgi:hypothetical protein